MIYLVFFFPFSNIRGNKIKNIPSFPSLQKLRNVYVIHFSFYAFHSSENKINDIDFIALLLNIYEIIFDTNESDNKFNLQRRFAAINSIIFKLKLNMFKREFLIKLNSVSKQLHLNIIYIFTQYIKIHLQL